ncbi:MAG: multicopper oxidase domain-containing protein [Gammaproteobacteria bacterium]|nr:multicopper oxidase domain-containing protein [Gammaproteobacteria bacterium]
MLAAAKRREFIFDGRRGGWAINGKFVDINKPIASPAINTPEVWRLVNKSGGWWHPVHVHLEFMRVLTRNGKQPPLEERDGQSRMDTVMLGPNDEVEVYFKFRDFPGPFVFHCHNIEHEDMFMMARFDVVG